MPRANCFPISQPSRISNSSTALTQGNLADMVSMPSLRESVPLQGRRCPFGKASNVDPDPLSPRGAGSPPPFFYRVEHKCGHEGCGLPHVLFLKSWRYLTDKTVERKALSAMPRTRCAEGHEFGPSFEFVNVREVFSLL